jgi:REP element-mobilizing transposase RayT
MQANGVFTPQYRKKLLFGQIRRRLDTLFHGLARRKECRIEEAHLMPDRVHILIPAPRKYSVAEVSGYLKEIWIAHNVEHKLRNFLSTNSGRGATTFRPWGGIRRWSAPISGIQRWRTSNWISCN